MVDVNKLRALLAAATPGPWVPDVWYGYDDGGWVAVGPHLHSVDGEDDESEPDCPAGVRAMADANLITAARDALPELLDEVERLRAENAQLRAENAQLRARTATICDCALVARAGCPDCGGVGAVMVDAP